MVVLKNDWKTCTLANDIEKRKDTLIAHLIHYVMKLKAE